MSEQAQQSQDQSQDRQSTYSERDRDSERGGGRICSTAVQVQSQRSPVLTVQRIQAACGEEIERFCSDVTPGGGMAAPWTLFGPAEPLLSVRIAPVHEQDPASRGKYR